MKGHKFEYFLDTNIFLRILVNDDPKFFKECLELFKKIEDGEIMAFTSDVIIAEVVWTLRTYYKLPKESVVESVQLINAIKNIKFVDSHDITMAIDIFSKNNVKFVDALIASCPLIALKKMKLMSYDKDFDKIGIYRIEPGDIIW